MSLLKSPSVDYVRQPYKYITKARNPCITLKSSLKLPPLLLPFPFPINGIYISTFPWFQLVWALCINFRECLCTKLLNQTMNFHSLFLLPLCSFRVTGFNEELNYSSCNDRSSLWVVESRCRELLDLQTKRLNEYLMKHSRLPFRSFQNN